MFKNLFEKFKEKIKTIKIPGFAGLAGFLGAYGGSHGTSLMWRRAGIAIISTIYAYATLSQKVGYLDALWAITVMSIWGAFSLGYGVPKSYTYIHPDKDNETVIIDEGSDIGAFWYKIFKGNHRMTDYFTRGTVGLTKSVSLLSIPLLTGNWVVYGLGSLGIILGDAMFSWRGWGSFKTKIFGKQVDLLWSDIVSYSLNGFFIYTIITFKLLKGVL